MHWQTIFRINCKAPVNMNHWLVMLCLAVSAPASSWPEVMPDNSDDSPKRVLAVQESVQTTAPQTFYQNEVDDGLAARLSGLPPQRGGRIAVWCQIGAQYGRAG